MAPSLNTFYMATSSPKRNPLFAVLIGFIVAGFFDFHFYFIEHRYVALGLTIIIPIAVFVALYSVHSRFAWAASLVAIVPLAAAMVLTYQLGYMGFPLTLPVAAVDVLLLALFVAYVWKRREPYLRYLDSRGRGLSDGK